jgi:pimeloyl-ACP methyl ester carboxylesterase
VASDDEAHAFLRELVVPKRHREARMAERLASIETTLVPTRWGDLAAWRLGSGPAVLLVHGFEDDNSLWSPLIDELADRGRAVVAFDLPGHGASGGDWGMSFEGTDAIVAVASALGPLDAVVAHSAGCGMAVAAIGEGWSVDRAALIAPPLGPGDRWLRKASTLGVSEDVAAAAKSLYYEAIGGDRATWRPREAYAALDLDLLIVHSRDDERFRPEDTEAVMGAHARTTLVLIDGPGHRRTARDPTVITVVADFVTP